MHYHLEVIIPPTDDVKAAVEQVMAPFNENTEDESERRHAFWDFWLIGGRWSGAKVEQTLDPERQQQFFDALTERKITVSGLKAGKDELVPATQIPMVDALFHEFFPGSGLKACPFFKHFNDQYKHSNGFPDVMRLGDTPKSLKCERAILAGPHWQEQGKLEAKHMVSDSIWNGVSHVDTKWDGTLAAFLDEWQERLERYADQFRAKNTPNDNWLVVTVDYHS